MSAVGPIDEYLAELSLYLTVGGRRRRRVLEEVADHLEEAVEWRQSEGETPEAAALHAIAQFGPPAVVARSFSAAWGGARLRHAVAWVVGAGALLVLVSAARHLGRPAALWPDAALLTVAGLAFQVTLIAGAVGAWRHGL
jgi:hypothetical protein